MKSDSSFSIQNIRRILCLLGTHKSIFLKAVEYHAEIILNVVIKDKYFIETAAEKSIA